MKKSFYLLIVCGIFVTCLFSGCKKDVKVSGIIVEPKNLYLNTGDVTQLSYMVTPYGADNKSVKWISNDISVATVSKAGFVTALSDGETQIVATTYDGYFTDTVSITVLRGSPAGDSIALIKLYEIAVNLTWDLTKSMDMWEGVVLNANRRVVYITEIFILKQLDASIANLFQLKSLSVSAAYATNTVIIPAEIGMLTELQYLNFHEGFTGTIPPELGNLTKLKELVLYHNQLTGSIPKELGNLTNLNWVSVFHNQLTGNIPKELGNLAKLEGLNLWANRLTGEIPQELGNLKTLFNIDLKNNSLSGNIPQPLLDRFGYWCFCPQNGTNFDNLDCNNY
jgi:hypothetical protein